MTKKIAFCLYGQPRYLEKGYEVISKFVENHDVDFYYHTWTLSGDCELYYHSYSNPCKEELQYKRDIIDQINSLYKPKAHVCELSRFFNYEEDSEFTDSIIYKNTSPYNKGDKLSNTISNFHSKQKVRDLLYDTIQKEKLQYDFVITSRFDFRNTISINLDDINNTKFYVSNIHCPRYIFSDAMVISNVEQFLKVFDFYNLFKKIINNNELKILVNSYNEELSIVPENILFSSYLYYYKDLQNVEYIDIPNFC